MKSKNNLLNNISVNSSDNLSNTFAKTAVIYARYSSNSQTEQSIEGQLRVCQEYAERNDIIIVNTYIDRAMTGTNDNRPDFQRMLKDSKSGRWNYVLVYKLDRFSRDKYETAMHKHELKKNGVKVISAMENIPDTPEGIILEGVIESMNEYYSKELSQKVKRGLNESRLKGNFTGGTIIYGYKVNENHKIVIDESEAEIVRYIYKQYSLGVFVKDILKYLKENKIQKGSKDFTSCAIYKILGNEKYSGIYKFDGKIYDNMYPQIVSTDVYEIVREKTNLNKYGKRSIDIVYMLRQKLTCGYCGRPISAECGTGKNGIRRYYYKCLGRKNGTKCQKSVIKKEILENFIIKTILTKFKEEKFKNEIADAIYKIQLDRENNNSLLFRLIKCKQKSQESLDNILKAIECGIINNTTNNRMIELEKEIEEIDRQITIEKSRCEKMLTKEEIKKYYIDALKLNPQMLINYLIKEITLFDDEFIITFNSPILMNPEEIQDFFYVDILKIKKYIQNKSKPIYIDILIKFKV